MNSYPDPSLKKKQELYSFLSGFISENKKNKFETIILQRTRYITLVLEDIFQPHNASAVLRTCDCFGVQDVHIIENKNKYEINPDVALGSSKWLSLYKYHSSENNTADCFQQLKDSGYRIIATTPHKKDFTPESLPLDHKIALVFGTEMEGLTPKPLS
jgi:tRNA (guanosine-2'-O-)-methyltransferase